MLYSTVLFDLDGTLIESGPGIFAVTRTVLNDMGLDCPDDEHMRKMVGPPLRNSLRDVVGVPDELVEEAAMRYRAAARTIGLELIRPYRGVVDMLSKLKEAKVRMGVVTSKLTPVARDHLVRYGLNGYIDYVRGGIEGAHGAYKSDLLKAALSDLGADVKSVVMGGGRKCDIEAANDACIDSVGVLYGYGDIDELKAHGATYIVNDVEELAKLLLSGEAGR